MPPKKRKGLPKKSKKKSSILFDFLEDITFSKKNILTEDNVHQYSKFMITKFLSMHDSYLQVVDEVLNKYQDVLDEFEFHALCIAIFPKKKVYSKYIRGSQIKKNYKEQINCIMDYFLVSEDQAFEYYQLSGDELVDNIKKLYGIAE